MDDITMDVKQFSTKWTLELDEDIDTSYGVDFAKELQQEIDNEVMIKMMVMNGWFIVKLDRFKDMNHPIEIEEWCNFTIGESKNNWSNFGTTYLFKKKEYAEWFSLRWL